MPETTINTRHGELPTYLANPTGDGPWPGVVVVHDAAGITRDTRRQTEWLAEVGYLAVAPDLFSHGRPLRCLVAVMREFTRGAGRVFDELEATRDHLAERADCTGRVGVLGFCMGGSFALALAATDRYAVASANYGGLPNHLERDVVRLCPVVASYGGKDPTLRGAAVRLDQLLTAAGVEHDVKEYPDAGHGFLEQIDWREVPLPLVLAGKLSRTRYHAPSAADARARILAFFERHLRQRPEGS
jgi:carboxymethylenebutenolidase